MKQKDWMLIIVIAFFSAVSAFLLSRYVINKPVDQQQKVEVVGAIKSEFVDPDKKYFNENSINPTKIITIGQDQDATPTIGDQSE